MDLDTFHYPSKTIEMSLKRYEIEKLIKAPLKNMKTGLPAQPGEGF